MSNSHDENRENKLLLKLKNLILDLGCDHIPTFGGKYEGGIHLQQVADEIAPCIYDLKKYNHKFRNFLEIGAAAGGNAYLFNHFFDFDHVTIIDDNKHPKHRLRKEILKDVNYSEWIGDSHTVPAITYLESLNLNYDIIFIDGDHSYGGVLNDYIMYRDFLNYKGFIIFHDTYACKGVKEVVDNMKKGAEMFQDHTTEMFPIKLFGDYIGKNKKLGITVFQIHTIPKWRDGK